jgi:hypothetical protein
VVVKIIAAPARGKGISNAAIKSDALASLDGTVLVAA